MLNFVPVRTIKGSSSSGLAPKSFVAPMVQHVSQSIPIRLKGPVQASTPFSLSWDITGGRPARERVEVHDHHPRSGISPPPHITCTYLLPHMTCIMMILSQGMFGTPHLHIARGKHHHLQHAREPEASQSAPKSEGQ